MTSLVLKWLMPPVIRLLRCMRIPWPLYEWRFSDQIKIIPLGSTLRIVADTSFVLHWAFDAWTDPEDKLSTPKSTTQGMIHYADIPVPIKGVVRIVFTFKWGDKWEHRPGEGFAVEIVNDRLEIYPPIYDKEGRRIEIPKRWQTARDKANIVTFVFALLAIISLYFFFFNKTLFGIDKDFFRILILGVWTIAVPVYFAFEWSFFVPDEDVESVWMKRWKDIREAYRNIWLAVIAVLTAFLASEYVKTYGLTGTQPPRFSKDLTPEAVESEIAFEKEKNHNERQEALRRLTEDAEKMRLFWEHKIKLLNDTPKVK